MVIMLKEKNLMKSWFEEEKRNNEITRNNKRRRERKIIYNDFYLASQQIQDIDLYWSNILKLCSQGKFPKRFSMSRGDLIFTKGTKIVKIKLTEQINEFINIVISNFRELGKIFSPKDIEELKILQDEKEKKEQNKEITWKSIKSKIIRNTLIETYVEEKYKEYDQYTINWVYDVICVGLESSKISASNIIMNQRKITDITNFTLLNNVPNINGKIIKKRPSSTIKKMNIKYRHYDRWLKRHKKTTKRKYSTPFSKIT